MQTAASCKSFYYRNSKFDLESQAADSQTLDDYDHVETWIVENAQDTLENAEQTPQKIDRASGKPKSDEPEETVGAGQEFAEPISQAVDEVSSIPYDTLCSPKVELTYYQRKMKQYEEEWLKSFGGGLGNIDVKPKLSKLQLEKKILQNSSETQNVVICRKRKLIEENEALFGGSLADVFKKISPKSKLQVSVSLNTHLS